MPTTTTTSTVSLFAPGVNQMINSIESAMTKLDGDVNIRFAPTPLATTTAPDGAAATVWNVRAHEYASINGHTTKIVEDQKFLESHNYFSAKDADGALLECHFDHIGAPATCVKRQPKHHTTVTTTYKHARPFATAFHRHVVKHRNATSSSSELAETSSQGSQSVAAAAVVQTTAPEVQVGSTDSSDSTTVSASDASTAGSNAKMNSTSGAAKKAKSLPVLLVTASVLFTAVLAFQP